MLLLFLKLKKARKAIFLPCRSCDKKHEYSLHLSLLLRYDAFIELSVVDDEQSIAVAAKHVAVLHGKVVGFHNEVVATESGGLHEER